MNATIAIKPETKQKMDTVKLCPTETYDHLIGRLLWQSKLKPESIKSTALKSY